MIRSLTPIFLTLALSSTLSLARDGELPPPKDEPRIINPGPPPSDAIVLFDGKDLSQWESAKAGPAKWKIQDGYAEVNGTGTIQTKKPFGDCQLHLEWATPAVVKGQGQGRGRAGGIAVFI